MIWSGTIHPHLKRWNILAVAMVVAAGCSTSDSPLRYTVEPPIAPFGELFAPPDTIRLDSSVVIGTVSFMDVSQEGHLLITDRTSRSTYQFSASGKHIQTYILGTCQPDHTNERVRVARFIGGGRVMLVGGDGAVAVLDESALCAATEYRHPLIEAACAIGDSVFMQARYSPYLKPVAYAVARDLEVLDTWQIAEPEFRRLNGFWKGLAGRSMECFADGPYYKYAEWPDALPVFSPGNVAQVDPAFFTKRERDIKLGPDMLERRDEIREYPTNSGIWAIDSTTRMILYTGLPNEWVPSNSIMRRGVAVVSHVGAFPAQTAIVPARFNPVGAANGYIYRNADPEMLPDGDVGNPLILRYKFIPPPKTNP